MKVAYCGINCESCKLYKATISNNDELRKEVAKEWGDLYKRTLNLSELNCLGCKSEIIYEACKKCDIKDCNLKRETENCNSCEEYSTCKRIRQFENWQKENNTEVEIIRYKEIASDVLSEAKK